MGKTIPNAIKIAEKLAAAKNSSDFAKGMDSTLPEMAYDATKQAMYGTLGTGIAMTSAAIPGAAPIGVPLGAAIGTFGPEIEDAMNAGFRKGGAFAEKMSNKLSGLSGAVEKARTITGK